MPRFQMERQEQGVRYTTLEVEADTQEEAEELIWEDDAKIISQHFKQHDAQVLSFGEVN